MGPSSVDVKGWGMVVRLVRVRVWVAGGLVEVTMPKSSSLVERAMGLGARVVAGMVRVAVSVLVDEAVRVPGPVPLRAMVQALEGWRVVAQSEVRV